MVVLSVGLFIGLMAGMFVLGLLVPVLIIVSMVFKADVH